MCSNRGRPKMKVQVKLFASFREIVGSKEEALELPAGSTVKDLLDKYIERYPKMSRYRDHIILSVFLVHG